MTISSSSASNAASSARTSGVNGTQPTRASTRRREEEAEAFGASLQRATSLEAVVPQDTGADALLGAEATAVESQASPEVLSAALERALSRTLKDEAFETLVEAHVADQAHSAAAGEHGQAATAGAPTSFSGTQHQVPATSAVGELMRRLWVLEAANEQTPRWELELPVGGATTRFVLERLGEDGWRIGMDEDRHDGMAMASAPLEEALESLCRELEERIARYDGPAAGVGANAGGTSGLPTGATTRTT